jgi:hypothetical protein
MAVGAVEPGGNIGGQGDDEQVRLGLQPGQLLHRKYVSALEFALTVLSSRSG